MMNIPGLTNSGSMPINAGAGPSSVGGNEEINFQGGSVSFGASGNQSPDDHCCRFGDGLHGRDDGRG
ncbi:hypothetical protein C9J03_22225 [Photobacterium gaetbulicola]|uniref:hypothetical protein n=1 Tax=Photobacterium gaetbulicola TaxID=1295392 RepID=UPI0005CBD743|nr:hypothetical protein [Photobacterium gaetbulicola]PSU02915.1 hypothetical protein C9J03_22225 [Photobacterium gaetbulicola]